MKLLFIIIFSIILGTAYYFMMEKSLPQNTNCSFISTIWTDIFAVFGSFIIIYFGIKHNENLLTLIGCFIIVEHILQAIRKYDNGSFKFRYFHL